MPTPGLSLVGFMTQDHALHHLRAACVPPPNAQNADLVAQWQAAKTKLGDPTASFGKPDIRDISNDQVAYADALLQLPWVVKAFQGQNISRSNIKLVEIDPLLAFQFTVDLERSKHHCGHLSAQPTLDQMFACALPTTQPSETFNYQIQGQSAIIKAKGLNLRVVAQGIIQNELAGVIFQAALPLIQVVRLNGNHYLLNGFHRAVGLRKAGATHLPCVLREVATAEEAGIRGNGATFDEGLLTSANPPTLGHFTQGRAADVQIRATSRILHVSWSDYVWPDE